MSPFDTNPDAVPSVLDGLHRLPAMMRGVKPDNTPCVCEDCEHRVHAMSLICEAVDKLAALPGQTVEAGEDVGGTALLALVQAVTCACALSGVPAQIVVSMTMKGAANARLGHGNAVRNGI